jgi:hypothetical protein
MAMNASVVSQRFRIARTDASQRLRLTIARADALLSTMQGFRVWTARLEVMRGSSETGHCP